MTIENIANHRDDCMLVKPEEILRMALDDVVNSNPAIRSPTKVIILVASENTEPGKLEVDYYKAGIMGLECIGLLELAKAKFVEDFGMNND